MSIIFKEDFEGSNPAAKGWVGKGISAPNVTVIVDPKNLSNHVLSFKNIVTDGDIFSPEISVTSGYQYLLCGRYLSINKTNADPADSGGYIGFTWGPNWAHDKNANPNDKWLLGTSDDEGAAFLLSDNKEWNKFESVLFSNSDKVYIMLEDRKGVPGDALFDDIIVINPNTSDVRTCLDYWNTVPTIPPIAVNYPPSILLIENFEDSNIAKKGWASKGMAAPNVTVIVDPKNPKNHVLSFNNIVSYGDIFSPPVISSNNAYLLCGRYLSIDKVGGDPVDSGGYIGFSWGPSLNYTSKKAEYKFLLGTGDSYEASPLLNDNREWNKFEAQISSTPSSTGMYLMLEDHSGVPGDAFFDDLAILDPDKPGINSCTKYWEYISSAKALSTTIEINCNYTLNFTTSLSYGGSFESVKIMFISMPTNGYLVDASNNNLSPNTSYPISSTIGYKASKCDRTSNDSFLYKFDFDVGSSNIGQYNIIVKGETIKCSTVPSQSCGNNITINVSPGAVINGPIIQCSNATVSVCLDPNISVTINIPRVPGSVEIQNFNNATHKINTSLFSCFESPKSGCEFAGISSCKYILKYGVGSQLEQTALSFSNIIGSLDIGKVSFVGGPIGTNCSVIVLPGTYSEHLGLEEAVIAAGLLLYGLFA